MLTLYKLVNRLYYVVVVVFVVVVVLCGRCSTIICVCYVTGVQYTIFYIILLSIYIYDIAIS